MNKLKLGHENITEAASAKAVSLTPDILKILEETREWAMEELDAAWDYSLEYLPPDNHPTLLAIEKWKKIFTDEWKNWVVDNIKKLNAMKLVADDELLLDNWYIVKLGHGELIKSINNLVSTFPLLKVSETSCLIDGKNIHTKRINDEENSIDAIYFNYGENFKMVIEIMEKDWFTVAWNEREWLWNDFEHEMETIFSWFPWKYSMNFPLVITEILWRGLAWHVDDKWRLVNSWEEIYFIGKSASIDKRSVYYISLNKNSTWSNMNTISPEKAACALFFKRPEKHWIDPNNNELL